MAEDIIMDFSKTSDMAVMILRFGPFAFHKNNKSALEYEVFLSLVSHELE